MAKMKSKKAPIYIRFDRQQRILDLLLSLREFFEDGEYLAECPELQLIGQGKSKRSAYDTLVEMILTTLIVAIETDTITEHLKALGFKKIDLPVPSIEIFNTTRKTASDTIPLIINSPLSIAPAQQNIAIEYAS